MSRELDAKVAVALDLDVVGEGMANPDPEVLDWWYPTSDEHSGNEMQPLFVAHCICELRANEEPDEWTPPKMLGHYPGCLEVVAFYSTSWTAMEIVLDKLRETCRVDIICYKKSPRYSAATLGDVGVAVLSMDFDTIKVNGDTVPEAVALAFLAAMGK